MTTKTTKTKSAAKTKTATGWKGGKRNPTSTVTANRERIHEALVKDAGPGGISRLTIEELGEQLALPPATIRRHLRALVAEKRIVRATGVTAANAETDGEKRVRKAMGAANNPRFQPSLTAITGNRQATQVVRNAAARVARRAERCARQRQARAEHLARLASEQAA